MLYFAVIDTGMGWMGLHGSTVGLRRIILPRSSREMVISAFDESIVEATEDVSFFGSLSDRLELYLHGNEVDFPDRQDIVGASDFDRAVWETTSTIPFGETRTYSWVAQEIGSPRALRAVGQALARNPLPIVIPCHRVIASTGALGGYQGDSEMKAWLLSSERSSLK